MECFSVDEGGYTGFDLLNLEQRFQGAAAIAITHEEASQLIEQHFPNLVAPELKYSSLARRPNNRERLLSLQKDVLAHHKCVTYVCNKRFLLILMFLDYAVEPFYYKQGFNFYEDGQNYSLGSLLYYTVPMLFRKDAFEALRIAFQKAMKEKTPDAINALVLAARACRWQQLPEALGPLVEASPECLAAIATPGVSTDAALVVLQSLISRMEVMADEPYQVEHDRSKNLLQYNALLQRFIAHDKAVEFTQSKIASIRFPLKLSAIAQVDSKESPSVQLADVLIGAAIEAANTLAGLRETGSDPQKLMSLYADHQIIHMFPSLNFEEQKKFRKGTQADEVIDYFSTHFHG